MLVFFIILCEVVFWVFVLGGLAVRYLLKCRSLGLVLLALAPVIDLVLLAVTVLDLRTGGTPTMAHGLAAVYIGVSAAFGKKMIAWADRRFAAKLCKETGTPLEKNFGTAHAAQERRDWLRHLLAFTIGTLLILLMIFLIREAAQAQVLLRIVKTWGIVLLIDFIVSFSYTLCPRKEKRM